MKHILSALLCLLFSQLASAQYKKASFFNRSGTSYEVGARVGFLSQSKCIQPSILFGMGTDKDNSRLFRWSSIEVVLPTTYTYSSLYTDFNTEEIKTATIKVKTAFGLGFRFNYGYFLVNNGEQDNKVLPFVTLGAHAMYNRGFGDNNNYKVSPSDAYATLGQYPSSTETFILGASGGLGILFRLSNSVGLKLSGGYTLQQSVNNDTEWQAEKSNYQHYKSHPFVSLGVRFSVGDD